VKSSKLCKKGQKKVKRGKIGFTRRVSAQHNGRRAIVGAAARQQWPEACSRDGDSLSAIAMAGRHHANGRRAGSVSWLCFVLFKLLLGLF